MIESIKAIFYPDYMTRRQKIAAIREKDRELSQKLAAQFEELDCSLVKKKGLKSNGSDDSNR